MALLPPFSASASAPVVVVVVGRVVPMLVAHVIIRAEAQVKKVRSIVVVVACSFNFKLLFCNCAYFAYCILYITILEQGNFVSFINV